MANPKGKAKDLEEIEGADDALEIEDLEEDALDGDLESDDPHDGDLEDDSLGIQEGESLDDEDDEETPTARKIKNDDDADDEDDEPEEGSTVVSKGVSPADVTTCGSCFLPVNTSQLSNDDYCPHCGDLLVGT